MADVFGTIGTNNVELMNAATESTLRMLLQASLATSKEQKENIKNLAQKMGLDADSIKSVNDGLEGLVDQTEETESTFDKLTKVSDNLQSKFSRVSSVISNLTSGEARASQLFASLEGIPIAGLFATIAKNIFEFQEGLLSAHQAISSSGATFAGSLTEMKMAASDALLSLDKFGQVIRGNSDVFSSLGGNLQQGVNKFVQIQSTLLAPGSETANNLASLGYSSQEAAELTASYIRSQGTLNKQDLQNTQMVSQAVQQYAQELTVLTELTGKNRADLQKKLDEENAEAQWQAFLAQQSPEKAAKLRQGIEFAMAQGGQGAVDAFKAMAADFPPLTRAGQLYAATQQAGMVAIHKYNDVANKAGLTLEQSSQMNRAALAKAIHDGAHDMDAMRTVLRAGGLTGSELSNTLAAAQQLQTKFMKDGAILSEAEIRAGLDKLANDAKVADSEAADAKKVQDSLNKMGQEILTMLIPIFRELTPYLSQFLYKIKEGIDWLVKHKNSISDAIEALKDLTKFLWDFKYPLIALGASILNMKRQVEIQQQAAALRGLSPATAVWVKVVPGFGGIGGPTGGAGSVAGEEAALEGAAKKAATPWLSKLGTVFGRVAGAALPAVGAVANYAAGKEAEERGNNAASYLYKGAAFLNALETGSAATGIGAVTVAPLLAGAGMALTAGGLAAEYLGGSSEKTTQETDTKKAEADAKKAEADAKQAEAEAKKAENSAPAPTGATPIEILQSEIQILNNTMRGVLSYLRDTADNTRRTVNEVHSLSGNLHPRP